MRQTTEFGEMIILLIFILYAILLSIALARLSYKTQNINSNRVSLKHPKRILIIGATGGTGRQLVKEALARGYVVTALVRNPSRLLLDHPQLTVLKGDVLDAVSVETAMHNQEAVVCALGHKHFFYPTRILSQGTKNILQAMDKCHVPRIVCETSLGIGDTAGRLGLYYTLFTIPVILPFYFWDKMRQEILIAQSSVEWVIVRPGSLTNAEKRKRFRHGRQIGSFIWTVRISRADVADFMLNQLVSDTYLRSAPGVAW